MSSGPVTTAPYGDRNHKPTSVVLTNLTSSPSSTNKSVIVARREGGNTSKKGIESPSSLQLNGLYGTSSGSNSSCSLEPSTGHDGGVWERRGELVDDSVIVQARLTTSAIYGDRSPSLEGDLVDSMHSQSSISTVIKRFDKKDTVDNEMNELPPYEAYVQSNAYAEMSTNGCITNQPGSMDKINQYDRSSSDNAAIAAAAAAMISHQNRLPHVTARESSLEPIGEDERLVQAAFTNYPQPSRSKRAEVLRFFSAANAFQIRVLGGDIQITDSDGCPLFDVYQELDCRQRWWNVEAYGDRVLLMREELSIGDGASSWGSRVTITDWNGELFGYLVTGDPLRMESSERVTVGRFSSQPAVVNNPACSNATSIPKACWICYTGGGGGGGDGREKQLARLEAYQRVIYLGDQGDPTGKQHHSNFHLKLMVLAGVIRIMGTMTVNAVSDCMALTKFFCNCCAYK